MTAPRPGRYRVVVECRSRLDGNGDAVWDAKLECGRAFTAPKRKAGGKKDRPAPLRKWCACEKCR